jgi:cobyrinic acid a,c-diamide synthase
VSPPKNHSDVLFSKFPRQPKTGLHHPTENVSFSVYHSSWRFSIKGIVIAGTSSGSGKTTVTLGLMAALKRRGLRVAPFKVGPDFIDPGHHGRVTGVPSRNLDGWMLPREYNLACFRKHARNADIAVVEGVMGLFDGYDGRSEAGSTAQMAKWLGLPALLMVDARSMARSAAAVVQGFENFDPDLSFCGVMFNHLGSPRHLSYLKEALEGHVKTECLGGLLRDEAIAIPERHLGLVTEDEHTLSPAAVDRLADLIENRIDLEGLLARLPEFDLHQNETGRSSLNPPAASTPIRIGVARDKAFCFYYPDNFDILRSYGAHIVFFSPVENRTLPPDLDGLYLGGGYPELFAEALADNVSMRRDIRDCSRNGMPVYAECGGFMYLGSKIRDTDDRVHAMCGVFPFTTAMSTRLKALGYREVALGADTPMGPAGMRIRGHEFHYSEIIDFPNREDAETVYAVSDRMGADTPATGFRKNRTIGSYIHLHFGSWPEAAGHFVAACRTFRQERRAEP